MIKDKREIRTSDVGRFYAHYESGRTSAGYRFVGTFPLGRDIEMVKELVYKHGYKIKT